MSAYHDAFCKFASELGADCSAFTLDALHEEFKKNALLGVGMCMEALPFQMMDDSEAFDLDTIQGDQAVPITTVFKVRPIQSKQGRERIAFMIKHAVDMEFV